MVRKVLTIGSHPNIAFYNWRLFSTKNCDLTYVMSSTSEQSAGETSSGILTDSEDTTFQWKSEQFGNTRYSLAKVYANLDRYMAEMNRRSSGQGGNIVRLA